MELRESKGESTGKFKDQKKNYLKLDSFSLRESAQFSKASPALTKKSSKANLFSPDSPAIDGLFYAKINKRRMLRDNFNKKYRESNQTVTSKAVLSKQSN